MSISNTDIQATVEQQPILPVVTETEKAPVRTDEKKKFIHLIRPLTVELIGTTLFILIGLWGACSGGGVLAAALSFGLAIMVFSASFGHISGVHFNPAVTIGVLVAGEIQAVVAILYVIMQLLGGIAAAGIVRLLLSKHVYDKCTGGATFLTDYKVPNGTYGEILIDEIHPVQGIFIELIATFVLVTVIVMVALDTKGKTGLAPLLIGFTLAVGILAVGAYTGGSLNPARSLGPAIFSHHWDDHYVYWIGPLVGAIVAGLFYRTVWAHYDRRLFVKRPAGAASAAVVKA